MRFNWFILSGFVFYFLGLGIVGSLSIKGVAGEEGLRERVMKLAGDDDIRRRLGFACLLLKLRSGCSCCFD